ncbi:hypothetical protein PMAYCL1PPCAC_07998, partial [Pristionchus mayeri]
EQERKKKKEEEKKRKKEEEVKRAKVKEEERKRREEEERRAKEDEERRREEEERERARKEEEKREEEARLEEERAEQERQRQLLDRETRKAEERRKKEEEEKRKRELEEEKRMKQEEKRKEIEKKKFEDAARLEEKEKEAAKTLSERRRLQREEDAERRREEQRKRQALALERAEEEERRQALSIAEKARLEEEEKRKKMEQLQSVVDSHLASLESPEQPRSIKAGRRRARKTGSRLQSSDSVDSPDFSVESRDASRETRRSDPEIKDQEETEQPAEFKVAVPKYKKKPEEVKFQAKTFIPVVAEPNEDDRRAAEKFKAFEEQKAKDERRLARLAEESRNSRETTPDSPKGQEHGGKNKFHRKKRDVFSAEFVEEQKRREEGYKLWSMVEFTLSNIFYFACCVIFTILLFSLLSSKFQTLAPSTNSLFSSRSQNSNEPSFILPLEEYEDAPLPENEVSFTDRHSLENTEELKCLLWVSKPGPQGATFCVQTPRQYHLSSFHDETIVDLADQESASFPEHLNTYEACDDAAAIWEGKGIVRTDGNELEQGTDGWLWWTNRWVYVEKEQNFTEEDAEAAYGLLKSFEMEACFYELCRSDTESKLDNVDEDNRAMNCYQMNRILARLSGIAFAGWGETKLMEMHAQEKKTWFKLLYPYKNSTTGERNVHVTNWIHSLKTKKGEMAHYDWTSVQTVPLPVNPRRFSEVNETTTVKYFKRLQGAPELSYEKIYIEQATERFNETEAKRWSDTVIRVKEQLLDKIWKAEIDYSDFELDIDICMEMTTRS